MGWFGMASDEKLEGEWADHVRELARAAAGQGLYVVACDLHI